MNKIYEVKFGCRDHISGVNIVVQGEDLTPEGAEEMAKESIIHTGGTRFFKKLEKACNLRDVIDITDKPVLIDSYYGNV